MSGDVVTVKIQNGSQVWQDMGTVEVGETVSGVADELANVIYMLDINEPQTLTLSIETNNYLPTLYVTREPVGPKNLICADSSPAHC